jgi:hypothetical protein
MGAQTTGRRIVDRIAAKRSRVSVDDMIEFPLFLWLNFMGNDPSVPAPERRAVNSG